MNNFKQLARTRQYSKSSALDTIISQAGISGRSLNTLIGNRPVNTEHKEDSEYETKDTSEILDPELNLTRLGYSNHEEICWQKIVLPEKKNLYLELYSRITSYSNADCKIYIDNEEFNCHLIVLQCYSELFDSYVAIKKVELPSDQVTAASFAFIYEWMITGEPSYREMTRENVLDIFIAAKYLKIKDLVEQCWAFIDNPEVFSEDTAFLLYMDAKEKELPEVREVMLPRIQGFFLMLVSSQDWLNLELDDVKNFLNSNYICVNCEMEVFMAAVRWLKHDTVNRDRFKYKVLECVRFGNIAPWQLIDIKRNPENKEFMEMAKDPAICKMIDDGLSYVIIKYWYGQENDDFQHWNSVLGLQEPPPRNWSGTDKTYFTYREFLIYLDVYRRNQLSHKGRLKSSGDQMEERKIMRKQMSNYYKPVSKITHTNDFVNKRKDVYGTISATRDIQVFHSHVNQSIRRRKMTRDEAARVIQRAYRKHHLKANVGREVMKKGTSHMTKKRSKVLSLFMTKNNKNAKLQTDVESCLTTPMGSSLFLNDKETILIFGGTDPHKEYGFGKNTGKAIYRYLADANSWEFVGELPSPRHYHCTAFFNGKIWLVGGADPRQDEKSGKFILNSVWSFDPAHRCWFRQEPLIESRKNLALAALNKNLFAIGGQGRKYEALKSVECYNLDKKLWHKVAPMNKARTGLAYTVYKNFVLVAGGLSGSNKRINVLDSVESYDVEKNQWTELDNPLRFPRCFSCMAVISDQIYVIGGAERKSEMEKVTSSIGTMEMWNEDKAKWQTIGQLSIPRHGHCVAYIGTQLVIIGGVSTTYGRALSVTECYCTQREMWIRGMPNLPVALSGLSAVTLPPTYLLSN